MWSHKAGSRRGQVVARPVLTVLPKSEISSLFCGCKARFVSDLVGNPEDRFSQDAAHIMMWPPGDSIR